MTKCYGGRHGPRTQNSTSTVSATTASVVSNTVALTQPYLRRIIELYRSPYIQLSGHISSHLTLLLRLRLYSTSIPELAPQLCSAQLPTMSTRGQFNTKSPTIKRIRMSLPPIPKILNISIHPPNSLSLSLHSKRSLRTRPLPLPRLPRRPPRNQPLRMALHAPRASCSLPLRHRHLPRPHHSSSNIPFASSFIPLFDSDRTV